MLLTVAQLDQLGHVLLDVFTADRSFGPRSKEALRRCLREGRVVACEAVLAEVAAAFSSGDEARAALAALRIDYEPLGAEAAILAGEAFRSYRARGGKRERVVADFLVGAHAQEHAARLPTRDRGFHRAYFASLEVLDPSTP